MDWDLDFGILSGPPVQSIESKTYVLNEGGEKGDLTAETHILIEDGSLSAFKSYQHKMDYGFEQRYLYNEDGFITAREHYDQHGFLQEKCEFNYNEEHPDMIDEIKVFEYSADDSATTSDQFQISYELDEFGRRNKEITYKPNGDIRTTVEFTYNDTGLLESKKRYRANGKWLWTDSLVYNDFYRVVKEVTIRPSLDEIKQRELVYSYDEQLNITGMQIGDTKQTYELEFDQHGNWIKKTVYQHQKKEIKGEKNNNAEMKMLPYTTTERIIVYELN